VDLHNTILFILYTKIAFFIEFFPTIFFFNPEQQAKTKLFELRK